MPKDRGYDIFPRTFKARLLLALAFVGGLPFFASTLIAVAFIFVAGDRFLPPPPCSGSEQRGCLEPQTELEPLSHDGCVGAGRRICFAPMGKIDPDLVRDLVQYYEDDYGLKIGVLTPTRITEQLIDPARQQLDAATLGDLIGHIHIDEMASPNIVLIGLTPVDLYDETSSWRFVFGIRASYEEPKGIVSTYRMHLGSRGLVDDDVVFERAKKMITKYIGLLYYGLEERDDPHSPLYNNILSVRDLDRMGDRLPVD